jgi:hypothetical protein
MVPYLFDFVDRFASRVFVFRLEAAPGFGCTITISNGTRLPRTADRSALLRAILSPRDHEFDGPYPPN